MLEEFLIRRFRGDTHTTRPPRRQDVVIGCSARHIAVAALGLPPRSRPTSSPTSRGRPRARRPRLRDFPRRREPVIGRSYRDRAGPTARVVRGGCRSTATVLVPVRSKLASTLIRSGPVDRILRHVTLAETAGRPPVSLTRWRLETDELLVRRFQRGVRAFESSCNDTDAVYNSAPVLGDAERPPMRPRPSRRPPTLRRSGGTRFTTAPSGRGDACSLLYEAGVPSPIWPPKSGTATQPSLPPPITPRGVFSSTPEARGVPGGGGGSSGWILVLADVQDLPYEEIAAVLDIPVGTVKSRVFRGRAALGRALGVARGEPSRASRTSEEEA